MQIIKLNAIDSTNTYLKNISKVTRIVDETVVMAKSQTAGRGQMGSVWNSKAGQSLTFSIFKRYYNLDLNKQFGINIAVSLGVLKALKCLNVPGLSVKWPNDIMSRSKKVGGILIENQLESGKIKSSVIGIGMNVNQTGFQDFPQATSLLLSTGHKFILDEVMETIINSVIMELRPLGKKDFQILKIEYENLLFRKNMVSVFAQNETDSFNGIIIGTTDEGKLIIETEEKTLHQYGLKEIKMLF